MFNLAIGPATTFFLAHDLDARARCLRSLSRPFSARTLVVLLHRQFALCLAVVAIRLLLRA